MPNNNSSKLRNLEMILEESTRRVPASETTKRIRDILEFAKGSGARENIINYEIGHLGMEDLPADKRSEFDYMMSIRNNANVVLSINFFGKEYVITYMPDMLTSSINITIDDSEEIIENNFSAIETGSDSCSIVISREASSIYLPDSDMELEEKRVVDSIYYDGEVEVSKVLVYKDGRIKVTSFENMHSGMRDVSYLEFDRDSNLVVQLSGYGSGEDVTFTEGNINNIFLNGEPLKVRLDDLTEKQIMELGAEYKNIVVELKADGKKEVPQSLKIADVNGEEIKEELLADGSLKRSYSSYANIDIANYLLFFRDDMIDIPETIKIIMQEAMYVKAEVTDVISNGAFRKEIFYSAKNTEDVNIIETSDGSSFTRIVKSGDETTGAYFTEDSLNTVYKLDSEEKFIMMEIYGEDGTYKLKCDEYDGTITITHNDITYDLIIGEGALAIKQDDLAGIGITGESILRDITSGNFNILEDMGDYFERAKEEIKGLIRTLNLEGEME